MGQWKYYIWFLVRSLRGIALWQWPYWLPQIPIPELPNALSNKTISSISFIPIYVYAIPYAKFSLIPISISSSSFPPFLFLIIPFLFFLIGAIGFVYFIIFIVFYIFRFIECLNHNQNSNFFKTLLKFYNPNSIILKTIILNFKVINYMKKEKNNKICIMSFNINYMLFRNNNYI